MVYNVPMCESETLDASHRDGIPTACGGSVVTATAAVVVMVEHGYLPYALIQLSCKGCCEKRERSLQPLWGARDFSFPLGVAERGDARARGQEGGWGGGWKTERKGSISLSFFSDLPVPSSLSGHSRIVPTVC